MYHLVERPIMWARRLAGVREGLLGWRGVDRIHRAMVRGAIILEGLAGKEGERERGMGGEVDTRVSVFKDSMMRRMVFWKRLGEGFSSCNWCSSCP